MLDRVTRIEYAAVDALLDADLPSDAIEALRRARDEQAVDALRLREGRRR